MLNFRDGLVTKVKTQEPMAHSPKSSRDSFSEPRVAALPGTFEELEQLLAACFNASTVGLGIIDEHFCYHTINSTLARMNGVPAGAHIGKKLSDILGPAAKEIESAVRRVLHTGKPVENLEFSLKLPGREEVGHWIENYFPIKDANGKVKQVGAVIVEITKEKRLEDELKKLSADIMNFLKDQRGKIAPGLQGGSVQDLGAQVTSRNSIDSGPDPMSHLTVREKEIVRLVAEGSSNKEIATKLGISKRTVENHRAKIMAKLHLRSLGELIRFAIRQRIVEA
jgi:PAS domain S-box-containing protein